MTGELLTRECCPGCSAQQDQQPLLRRGWDDPGLAEHLRATYGSEIYLRVLELAGERAFVLMRCGRCRLAYQRLAPDDALAAEIYDEWIDAVEAEEYDASKGQSPLLANQVLELIHHFDRPVRQIKVLDYGAGSGEWCRVAYGLGCDTYGADLSTGRQSSAEKQGVRLLPLDALADHVFDFINLEQVAEHVTWPLQLVTSLATSLAADGVMRISVPNARDLDRRLRAENWGAPKGTKDSLNVIAPLQHLNAFQHQSLVTMCAQAGMHPVRRASAQLRFTPVVGPLLGCVRFGAVRFVRSALRQDTQIWFVREPG